MATMEEVPHLPTPRAGGAARPIALQHLLNDRHIGATLYRMDPSSRSVALISHPPLSQAAKRSYAFMRWLPLVAVTTGVALQVQRSALAPGVLFLALLIVAYIALVRRQHRCEAPQHTSASLRKQQIYLLLSALLFFGMMTAPSSATNAQSLWYCVMYFVIIGEGAYHLRSVLKMGALVGLCIALVMLAVLLDVPRQDWLVTNLQLLALYTGLIVSAIGGSIQGSKEVEHAERLILLEELARSKQKLEEANYQLQVYASAVEQLAVADERTRMARELHDILGYTLATVVVKAEAAKRLLANDAARVAVELDQLQEVARSGLADVRRSVRDLRHMAPSPGIWHEVAAHFVAEFAPANNLIVHCAIDPLPERHDPDLEVCLFRVIQEALTNVARHAQAAQVTVTLRVTVDHVALCIEDDGKGVGLNDAPASGFGLRGMRERVALHGGTLVFNSRRGEGTQVLVTLPLAHMDSGKRPHLEIGLSQPAAALA